jgi:hypothetical protein
MRYFDHPVAEEFLPTLRTCVLSKSTWLKRLHRRARCDLSLFRLGLRLLARCLKDTLPIPEGFLVPAVLPAKPARRALNMPHNALIFSVR